MIALFSTVIGVIAPDFTGKVLPLGAISLRAVYLPAPALLVHLDLEPALLPVIADPNQMHQTLLNLGSNSRDAMPDGGDLTIATRNAPSSDPLKEVPDDRRSTVVLEVTDTGIGMTPETQERIFEPFCTTFSIFMPAAEDGGIGEAARAPEERPGAESRKGTVLLVEDEEAVRKFVLNVMEREGYAVMEARDGLEGEAIPETTGARPDLLLSDIIMPRMGGVQLARSVRKSHPEIPILLMSSYTEEDFNRRDAPGVFFQVLQKPFSSQALFGKIAELLEASDKA